jgi:hypothetical protein
VACAQRRPLIVGERSADQSCLDAIRCIAPAAAACESAAARGGIRELRAQQCRLRGGERGDSEAGRGDASASSRRSTDREETRIVEFVRTDVECDQRGIEMQRIHQRVDIGVSELVVVEDESGERTRAAETDGERSGALNAEFAVRQIEHT